MHDYIITVATEEEKQALIPKQYWDKVVITGIGILNTIIALRKIEKYDNNKYSPRLVINVGYAGSKDIPVGTVCKVSKCSAYKEHNLETSALQIIDFITSIPSYTLYTATDFIESSKLPGPFLVDMELLAHSVLLCPVASIKVVSDNMNIDDYFGKALKSSYTNEIEKVLHEMGVRP